MEEWKEYPKNPKYLVSNMGRVRRVGTPVDIPPRHFGGYYRIVHCGTDISLHILVADVWIPNPDNLPVVKHLNGNKHDNRASNLEWRKNGAGRPRKTPDPFQHLRDEPVRLPKIIDNRYSLLPIPGTIQWSVYFIGGVRAVHLGMYESQKEAEDSVR